MLATMSFTMGIYSLQDAVQLICTPQLVAKQLLISLNNQYKWLVHIKFTCKDY
jgi:hypothetical protein